MITEAQRLSGTSEYYFSQKLQEIRTLEEKGKSVINLGIGNPDMMPSSGTIEVLSSSALKPTSHGYQSYKGIPALRQAIAKWSKSTYDITLNPDTEVLPLLGSKEGIMHISMAFINPGDEVLIPNPGYPTYAAVSNIVGASVITYDLDSSRNWEIDIEELKNRDLSKVKLLWMNYPHMPTGASGSSEMFDKIIDLAEKNNFLIVNDNPYSLILNDHPMSMLNRPKADQWVIELNSLSKSHNMAGWRVGWLAGNEQYITSVLKVKSNIDSGMFLPVQHAAVEAMNNPISWHQEQNREYAMRKVAMLELLDVLGATYDIDQSGMFIWAKAPDSISNLEEFIDQLIYEAGVFITPGFIFGSNGHGYIRVSLCSTVETIGQAKQRIIEYLNSAK